MQCTEEENIPGLLLLVDFEKEFNSVSWSFIKKSPRYFNFGEFIRKWMYFLFKHKISGES